MSSGHRVHRPKTSGLKLDKEKAEQIRELYRKGISIDDLALKFGVKPRCIRDIIADRAWKECAS